jgi:hypothetical protein
LLDRAFPCFPRVGWEILWAVTDRRKPASLAADAVLEGSGSKAVERLDEVTTFGMRTLEDACGSC